MGLGSRKIRSGKVILVAGADGRLLSPPMALVHGAVTRALPPRAHLNGCQGWQGAASSARAIASPARSPRFLFQLLQRVGGKELSKITTWLGLEEEGSGVQPGLLWGSGNHEPGEGQGENPLACRKRWLGLLAESFAQVLLSRNSQGKDSGARMQPGSR